MIKMKILGLVVDYFVIMLKLCVIVVKFLMFCLCLCFVIVVLFGLILFLFFSYVSVIFCCFCELNDNLILNNFRSLLRICVGVGRKNFSCISSCLWWEF